MLMNFKSKYTVNVICLCHWEYEVVSIRMYFLSILRNFFTLSIAFENSFALSSTAFQYDVHIESTYWYNLNDIIETWYGQRLKPQEITEIHARQDTEEKIDDLGMTDTVKMKIETKE